MKTKQSFVGRFRWILHNAVMPAPCDHILRIMIDAANPDGSSSHLSQATLGQKLERDERTIRRYLTYLKETGWLVLTDGGLSGEGGHGGIRRTNVYQVTVGEDFSLVAGAVVLNASVEVTQDIEPEVTPEPAPEPAEDDEGFSSAYI